MTRARPALLVLIAMLLMPLVISSAPIVEAQGPATGARIDFQPAGPVVVGSSYDVVGSGFRPNTWVTVGAGYDTIYWYSGVTDDTGRVRLTLDARAAGSIRHDAFEQRRNGVRLRATAVLSVVEAP